MNLFVRGREFRFIMIDIEVVDVGVGVGVGMFWIDIRFSLGGWKRFIDGGGW